MEEFSAQYVADSFVKQYYLVLNKSPENVYRFYKELSLLSWPGPDGVVVPVTTSSGINDRIVSSDFAKCFVETESVDAQDSLAGAIMVAVAGFLTGKDNARKKFFQAFVLAKQENGFFVLNDILYIFYNCKNNQASAPVRQNSVAEANTIDNTASSKTKDADENGNVHNENLDSNPEPASDTQENSYLIRYPASDSKDDCLPVENGNVEKEVDSSVQKITYASVVKTGRSGTCPETAKIPSNGEKALSPPPIKVSASAVAGATNTTGHAAAATTGIYIGRLPIDIDKQGILKVVTKFGPVRKSLEGIQIRRHEDGFCWGFVEFESSDSARRAVEARHVNFGEEESYISYKRSSYQGNGIRRSSYWWASKSQFRTRENGQVSNNKRFYNKQGSGNNRGQA